MAKIGLSKPYAARYGNNGSTVTYTGGALMGKAVQMSIELDSADDNILYADNGPAESENTFSGGTMKLTTDDLMPDVMLDVLGVTEKAIAGSGIQTTDPKWFVWDDNQETPYMGYGAIAMIQKGQKVKYQAVILPKVKFTNPNDTFNTKGEKIEWGTPEISANILRSDAEGHPWKMISSTMDSEADAEAAIKEFLNISGE
ncbi:MAG: major tail protein [Anaerotignum sp.]